jgi:hypothetical protein
MNNQLIFLNGKTNQMPNPQTDILVFFLIKKKIPISTTVYLLDFYLHYIFET